MRRNFISVLLSIIVVLGVNNLDCAASLPKDAERIISIEKDNNPNVERFYVFVHYLGSITHYVMPKSCPISILDNFYKNCYYVYNGETLAPSFSFNFYNIPNGACINAIPKALELGPSPEERIKSFTQETARLTDVALMRKRPVRAYRRICNKALSEVLPGETTEIHLSSLAQTIHSMLSGSDTPTIIPPPALEPSTSPLPIFWKNSDTQQK